MKQFINYTLAIAAMLLIALGASADNTLTSVTYKIDGQNAEITPGNVKLAFTQNGSKYTGIITVTPGSDYYLQKEDLTIKRTISTQYAQTRGTSFTYDEDVTITEWDENADPNGETTYKFDAEDGKYDYEITANFHKRISINGATVGMESSEYTFTGDSIKPVILSVRINDEIVLYPEDGYYYVEYKNDVNVPQGNDPEPTVIVKGIGKYIDEASQTFTITPKSITGVTITLLKSSFVYNGEIQKPEVSSVKDEDRNKVLEVDKDYTITNDGGTDVDEYSVTITGIGNYKDSKEATFEITELDLQGATITLDHDELPCNGEPQTVNVTKVKIGELEVPEECYEVSGNTQTYPDVYTLTVKAKTKNGDGTDYKNNFKGEEMTTYQITARTITADLIGLTEKQTYATYYNEQEFFMLPNDIVAYIVTGISGTNLVIKRINYIPNGVAVLVKSGTSDEVGVDSAEGNLLKGTNDEKAVSTITDGNVYVLYNGEFLLTTSGSIPAHRCYLVVSEAAAGANTRAFSIGDSNSTTGVESSNVQSSIFNIQSEECYDLQGRHIQKPSKAGIYIVNGKKVVIK